MEDRKRRLEALRQLAEQSVQRDEDGLVKVKKLEAKDEGMLDDILRRKKQRIRDIFKKERDGEYLKEILAEKKRARDLEFQGMTEEELEERAAREKERRRRQFEALK